MKRRILCRLAQFVEFVDEIDQSMAKLVYGWQEVKLQLHVSAGWYAIVATGYCGVDIRKCYSLTGVNVRPTKSGITLRQIERRHLKEVAKNNNKEVSGSCRCSALLDERRPFQPGRRNRLWRMQPVRDTWQLNGRTLTLIKEL
jgi:hypothetical protein